MCKYFYIHQFSRRTSIKYNMLITTKKNDQIILETSNIMILKPYEKKNDNYK